jgi:peptide/nickel transport system permease protein
VIRYISKKLGEMIIVLLLVTGGTAALSDLIPGSPSILILGEFATPQAIAELDKQYGFSLPFWERYWHWLQHAVQGDFGRSVQSRQSVVHVIATHLPVTLELAVATLVLSLLIAVPLAMLCALRAESLLDRIVTGLSSAVIAIPSFVSCVVLAVIFANTLHLFPNFGWVPLTQDLGQNLWHATLPITVLTLSTTQLFIRVLRPDLVSVLREDYILAARVRGMPDSYIMLRHALRPACLSLFTLTGLVFAYLVGGTIVLETYFALPGVGQVVAVAAAGKDLPLVQGIVVIMAFIYLFLNTMVDLGLAVLDPESRPR